MIKKKQHVMDFDTYVLKESENQRLSKQSEPCISVTVSPQDVRKMEDFLKTSDYYGEPVGRDYPYTWNFPEDEDTLDALEIELRDALNDFGINVESFESC